MGLIERFLAWRTRRYWQKRQFDHLRKLILSDWQWLAHDPVANELTTRYKRALSEGWYQLGHESSDALRKRLGLDPRATNQEGQQNG